MEKNDNVVGEALRQARLARGMTQAALGVQLGYSAMAISHFEKGTRPIRVDELRRASTILGCDLVSEGVQRSETTLFRASNMRGGASAIDRSLQMFDQHINKKYGFDDYSTEGN